MSAQGSEPSGSRGLFNRLAGERPARLWTVLGGAASVVAVLLAVFAPAVAGSTAPSPAPPPGPAPNVGSLSASASPPPPRTLSAAAADEGVQYLDDYAQRCQVGGSIQRTGPANINGTTYSHAISQTPNGYTGTTFYLARHAHRFQATVGPTDDGAQGDRVQFELVTETGSTLFTSAVLSIGQTQVVDVSVEGVLRLSVVAKLVGNGVGAQGTAGWGDPRVTATELTCP
jgi:hypothetical protein